MHIHWSHKTMSRGLKGDMKRNMNINDLAQDRWGLHPQPYMHCCLPWGYRCWQMTDLLTYTSHIFVVGFCQLPPKTVSETALHLQADVCCPFVSSKRLTSISNPGLRGAVWAQAALTIQLLLFNQPGGQYPFILPSALNSFPRKLLEP